MGRFPAASFLGRKQAPRVTPLREAPVEVQVMSQGTLDVLRARNVSQTGIGVCVPHDFAGCDLDQQVELVITLPGERSFLVGGTIVHRTEDGAEGHHFGLHFTRLTPAQADRLRRYIRSRLV